MNTQILIGDCRETLKELPSQSVQMCVTSPPYFGLRDYGNDAQIGMEKTPDDFVSELVAVFREVHRVLRDDGTLWLNIGDSYARAGGWSDNHGLDGVPRGESGRAITGISANGGKSQKLAAGCKTKDLIGIPWMLAFALRADGWYLRQDIIWHKPNPMPESVRDRCTKSHEYLFLLTKSEKYYFDNEAIKEPAKVSSEGIRFGGKKYGDSNDPKHATKSGNVSKEYDKANKRSVWTVPTRAYSGAHFATFPPALIEPCILAGSKRGDIVLDPFGGSGTTAAVAEQHGRKAILCELNKDYVELALERLKTPIQHSILENING